MTSHDLSLLGLPHDIRLELFSWLTLPPFETCTDDAGLWLSCREFHQAANREGTRRLGIYLRNISRSTENRNADDPETNHHNDTTKLHFDPPLSIYNHPLIRVQLPLLLPPEKHKWHLLPPPPRMCGTGLRALLSTPGPRRDRYEAERRKRDVCRRQQEAFQQRVRALIAPLAELHHLYANIEIRIVADERALAAVSKKVFAKFLDGGRRLPSVVLGKVLEVYVDAVCGQRFSCMRGEGDLVRLKGECGMVWDFGGRGEGERMQERWGPSLECWEDNLRGAVVSFTEDRREGEVQFSFDWETYLKKKGRR